MKPLSDVDNLSALDALGQADLVRRGAISPLELVDAAIARIERANPHLNAVVVPWFERAREQAMSADLPKGPFQGVPLLLKDSLCHTAGDPHYEGMRFLRDLDWREQEDSFVARRFRDAGFIILGRTNTPELSILPTTEPEVYGPCHNPWKHDHSTGGSSGGSAAAVAARMVPAAHGADGGGSIRVPASECGVVGFRASRGRISNGPEYNESQGPLFMHYVQGVLTRTVRDSAAILDVLAGSMPGDVCMAPPPERSYLKEMDLEPGPLRIGLMPRAPEGLETHPECIAAVEQVGRTLESLGHIVEESFPIALTLAGSVGTMPPPDPEDMMNIPGSAIAWLLDYWSRRTNKPIGEEDVEPYTWVLAEIGRQATALSLLRGMEFLAQQARRISLWWAEGYDALVTPTMPIPPPHLGYFAPPEENPLEAFSRTSLVAFFTGFLSLIGHPAVSLPLGWSADRLPIGVQVATGYGREDVLLRLSHQLEQASPWIDRLPEVYA